MKLKEKAKELKKQIPAVFLCLKDKRTPFIARILAAVTVVYALSPVDLIPDFIPVLGYLDDVIILPLLIILTVKAIPEKMWNGKLKEAENMWQDGKPKKWHYAVPFVVVWLLIALVVAKLIYGYYLTKV